MRKVIILPWRSVPVLRNGSWGAGTWFCRAAHRDGTTPGSRALHGGFRVCFYLDSVKDKLCVK